jgi:hypothetical protein
MLYSFSLNDTASYITMSGTTFTVTPPSSGGTIMYLIEITPTVLGYSPQPTILPLQQILVTILCD